MENDYLGLETKQQKNAIGPSSISWQNARKFADKQYLRVAKHSFSPKKSITTDGLQYFSQQITRWFGKKRIFKHS